MKKPWNLPDSTVYSLATYNENKVNMNICTYVTPISMKPKLYAIAVYENTKTLELLRTNPICVLQLLNPSQYNLVTYLGKKTGHNFDKHAYLIKRNLLELWQNHLVLKNTSALLMLEKIDENKSFGDHVVFVFKVIQSKTFTQELLNNKLLIQKKIIRA